MEIQSNILSRISSLRGKISTLKSDYIKYIADIKSREENYDKNPRKLEELLLKQSSGSVSLNVGGEVHQVSLNTLKSRRGTLFYKQILRGIIKPDIEVFYDRDPTHFTRILNFLRYGKINTSDLPLEKKEELLNEATFYEINYIIEVLKATPCQFEIQAVNIQKPYLVNGKRIGDTFLATLKNTSLTKGFTSDSPGEIIFKFNREIQSNELHVGGYNGNSTNWYVKSGEGSEISISMDSLEWKSVGFLPSDFGFEIKKIMLQNNNSKFRYIRFKSENQIGIGYLDFKENKK